MAALLDIRRRIRSVKSTQQITRAMKMVAAARLRKAQDRIFNARPYANQMMALLSSVAARTTERCHPLLQVRPIQRQLLIHQTAVPIPHVEQEELLAHHAWASGACDLGVGARKGTLQICCQPRI